ncbi:unnamed protein product [Cuscuta europaea]|uniref:MULE transposase domain-containing protein n=1 Tax=Cuscuta europaea TaxID=41803 RepID=A0A9P0Z018_CUSEU|nr:unnamed protein product [Cuscuta europaea]
MKLRDTIKYRHDLYIVSDRHKRLMKAASEIFPHVIHGFCVEHLRRNLIHKFRGSGDGLGWKFKAAYMAATIPEYEEYLAMQDVDNAKIRLWLDKIGSHRWARCMAGPRRFGVLTSNCAESLNKVNVTVREYSISKLIDFLRQHMQKWFTERSEKASKKTTILSSKCEKHLVALQYASTHIQVKPSSYLEFEVVDRDCRSFIVNLSKKMYSCGVF